MDGDIVCLAIEFIQGNTFKPGFLNLFRGDDGIMNHHPHSQTAGTVGHNGADLAETDDPQDFIVDLPPLELLLLPLSMSSKVLLLFVKVLLLR